MMYYIIKVTGAQIADFTSRFYGVPPPPPLGQPGRVQSTPNSGRMEYSSCLACLGMVVVVVMVPHNSVT